MTSQKQKSKSALPKTAPGTTAPAAAVAAVSSSSSTSTPAAPVVAASATAPPVKTTLADWTAQEDDDVNGFYVGEKRQRGGRKKRRKNNREAQVAVQNWDDIYDPSRPNNYEEYVHSDEKIAEVREWKDRLYAHRMRRYPSSDYASDEEYSRPMNRTCLIIVLCF